MKIFSGSSNRPLAEVPIQNLDAVAPPAGAYKKVPGERVQFQVLISHPRCRPIAEVAEMFTFSRPSRFASCSLALALLIALACAGGCARAPLGRVSHVVVMDFEASVEQPADRSHGAHECDVHEMRKGQCD